MNAYCKLILVSILLLCQSCTTNWRPQKSTAVTPAGQTLVVEGQAAIVNNTRQLARKLALQDAVRQASLQAGASVNSHTLLNQGSVQRDTLSLHAAAAITNTQILDEWETDGVYTVRAKVLVSKSDSCVAPYRKRIMVTAFPPVDAAQLSSSEAQDVYAGVAREIGNNLMQSRDFIARNATQITLYDKPALAPELQADEPYQTSLVMQLARDQGVQFVLSGVIRDLQIEPGDLLRGDGPVGMAKSVLRDYWSRRGIGLDVYVHDGFTGALIFQYRYNDSADGDVWLPADYTVGSERFKATETGEKITQIISKASADIRRSLSCYPFATRIVSIEKDKIVLDAGAQENLHVGDQLVVYADGGNELTLEGGSRYIARDKQPVGVMTLAEVRPRYASGFLEVPLAKAGVRVGDWVRSW